VHIVSDVAGKPGLAGRTALVTGSTGSVGLAIATELSRQGCKVMLNGLEQPGQGEAKAAELARATGVATAFHPADLADVAQIEDMVRTTERKLGPIDVLVNNAVTRNFSHIDVMPRDDWDRAVAVNLSAPFHLIKLTLPGMKERKWGRIINLASNWGLTGTVGRSDYVATKHGLVGLTKAVALEALPYNVTCNALAPGSIMTPHAERQVRERMARDKVDWDTAAGEFLKTRQPSGRFVTGEKVAQLVVFLCSDAASEMTGNPIAMDGGWLSI
jgi:3-hydroxybutyrate dehydrogenase